MKLKSALPVLATIALFSSHEPVDGQTPAPTAGIQDPASRAVEGIVRSAHHPNLKWPDFPFYQDELQRFYQPAGYQLAWINGTKARKQSLDTVAVLKDAGARGLPPEDYDVDFLEKAIQGLSPASTPADLAHLDTALTLLLMRHISDIHIGRINPKNLGYGYDIEPRKYDLASLVRKGITEDRITQTVHEAEPQFIQYTRLKEALAQFRAAGSAGTPPAAVDIPPRKEPVPVAVRIRKLELALERMRWLPDARDRRAIVVNIPGFRLFGFEDRTAGSAVTANMNVVVGKALRTETPAFAGDMRFIIFRPYWYPPYSIIKKEIVPGWRKNPNYVAKHNMEIVAGMNDAAPPLPVTADNMQKVLSGSLRIRQKPGPKNSLGLAKFMFPNSHSVYLHGTPAQALFARSRRDFSHGCVRVEDPAALALWVLKDQPEWTPEKIKEAMNGSRPVRVDLEKPVAVLLYYTTAVARPDGTVAFYDDIYKLDDKLDIALKAGEPYEP